MKSARLALSILALIACPLARGKQAPLAERAFAVIGDSLSSGSFTHPRLHWDVEEIQSVVARKSGKKGEDGKDIWELNPAVQPDPRLYSKDWAPIVVDKEGKVPAPTRLWEKATEHERPPLTKGLELAMKELFLGRYLDVEEYAWPYLLGRALGIPASRIYVPAEAGNRSGDTPRQVKRLLSATGKVIPDLVFLFFTGNDLCSTSLDANPEEKGSAYAESLLSGVSTLLSEGSPRDGATAEVFFVSHLAVDQLIAKKEILEKEVYAFGKFRSCREFRRHDPGDEDIRPRVEFPILRQAMTAFGRKNLPSPRELCRSVLSIDPDDAGYGDAVGKVRAFTTAYQKAVRELPKRAEALRAKVAPKARVRFHALVSPEKFSAVARTLANDCFHLALEGNEALAATLLAELRERKLAGLRE